MCSSRKKRKLDPSPLLSADSNYGSCAERIDEVRNSLLSDVQDNLCIGPVAEQDAKMVCQGGPLYLGALGSKEGFSLLPDTASNFTHSILVFNPYTPSGKNFFNCLVH